MIMNTQEALDYLKAFYERDTTKADILECVKLLQEWLVLPAFGDIQASAAAEVEAA